MCSLFFYLHSGQFKIVKLEVSGSECPEAVSGNFFFCEELHDTDFGIKVPDFDLVLIFFLLLKSGSPDVFINGTRSVEELDPSLTTRQHGVCKSAMDCAGGGHDFHRQPQQPLLTTPSRATFAPDFLPISAQVPHNPPLLYSVTARRTEHGRLCTSAPTSKHPSPGALLLRQTWWYLSCLSRELVQVVCIYGTSCSSFFLVRPNFRVCPLRLVNS